MPALGNAYFYAMQVTHQGDDTLRKAFLSDAASTVNIAFTLMTVQKNWAAKLQAKRNEYMQKVMSGEKDANAQAKILQSEYESLVVDSDNHTEKCQQILQAKRTTIDEDNRAREDNITLESHNMAAVHFISNLIQKKG